MAALEIKLNISDSLAREAEANGLLNSQSIENLLRAEIQRRRVDKLFAAADQLANLELPPMTAAEVEAEIQAVRSARRFSQAA